MFTTEGHRQVSACDLLTDFSHFSGKSGKKCLKICDFLSVLEPVSLRRRETSTLRYGIFDVLVGIRPSFNVKPFLITKNKPDALTLDQI